MSELKNCPQCGKSIEIHVHPEWDEKVGVVYGALIIHKECVAGMETSIYSINRKKTREEAYDTLATAWNTRQPRFTSSEIQAIEAVLKMAEQSEGIPFKEVHLSRVRFMLEEQHEDWLA